MASVFKRPVTSVERHEEEQTTSGTQRRREERQALNALSLPDTPSKPAGSLSEYTILIYGLQKIGKTTMCSHFEDAFFLMCEPGAKALSIYQRSVGSWKEFLRYLELLEAGGHKYRNLVIDTVDVLYGYCYDYCCQKHAVEHPSEIAYGVVWSDLRKEFTKGLLRAAKLSTPDGSVGLILISHEVEKELRRKNGESTHQITSSLPTMAREIVESMVDLAAHYCYNAEGKRELCLEGDDMVVAGCRPEDHFMLTKRIPMGSSSEASYRNFIQAYNNKPIASGEEKVTESTNKPVRRRVR